MIMIASRAAAVALPNLPRGVAKTVPDGRTTAILLRRAFDLVSGRGRAPKEILGESWNPAS